jgi:hypothetical protein
MATRATAPSKGATNMPVKIAQVKTRIQAAQAALELASLTAMFPEVRQAVNAARTELRAAMAHMSLR